MVNRRGCLWSTGAELLVLTLLLTMPCILTGCQPATPKVEPPPAVTKVDRCLLDGTVVYRGEQTKRPLAVVVDNDPAAWPVSGLSRACIVYEVPVEGGLTRFIALYQHLDTAMIGPVRSLRSHFVPFVTENGALVAHVGGSPAGLAAASNLSRLDELTLAEPFWLASDRERPYATYTNTDKMRTTAVHLGFSTAADSAMTAIASFDDATAFTAATASTGATAPQAADRISIGGGKLARVDYRYDTASLTYIRAVGGRDVRDGTGAVSPKTVIVLTLPKSARASDPEATIKLAGQSGTATYYSEGVAVRGTWSRDASAAGRLQLGDAAGKPIVLRPGQIWVHLVYADEPVTPAIR